MFFIKSHFSNQANRPTTEAFHYILRSIVEQPTSIEERETAYKHDPTSHATQISKLSFIDGTTHRSHKRIEKQQR